MAITRKHEAEYTHWQAAETKIIDGVPVRFSDVCVHKFNVGDVEDPDLFAGEPLWQWQESEAGQWVMENAVEKPYWTRRLDTWSYGHTYCIMARLSDKNQIFWKLKWGGLKQ